MQFTCAFDLAKEFRRSKGVGVFMHTSEEGGVGRRGGEKENEREKEREGEREREREREKEREGEREKERESGESFLGKILIKHKE